jgi:hypothetical protein
VIVASALVDALGEDGRDVERMARPREGARRGDRAPRVKVDVAIEATDKKSFATAVDWPGWSRSGKTEELAIEALLAYADATRRSPSSGRDALARRARGRRRRARRRRRRDVLRGARRRSRITTGVA